MTSDDKLVEAFEAGEIDAADFPHERHVRVAWALAQRYEPDDGLRRLIAGYPRHHRARRPRERVPRDDHQSVVRADRLRREPRRAPRARRQDAARPLLLPGQ